MKAYFISGLGADENVFKKIVLPSNYEAIHLKWMEPLKDESMNDYAKRMCEKVNTKEDFVLIGLSLGGMIATEMNKFITPQKTILLSSASTRHDLPLWIRMAGNLRLHSLAPHVVNKNKNRLLAKFLGARNDEEIGVITGMRKNSSRYFSIWAIQQIISWQNKDLPQHMIHIHGTSDRMLLYRKNKNMIPVKKGSHFMVYNKANEINEILKENLP